MGVGWYGGEGVKEDGEESVEKEDVSSSKCEAACGIEIS